MEQTIKRQWQRQMAEYTQHYVCNVVYNIELKHTFHWTGVAKGWEWRTSDGTKININS